MFSFMANDLQGTGAGRGRAWSPDVDSRIGGQPSAALRRSFLRCCRPCPNSAHAPDGGKVHATMHG
jgi:hypothetical protein